MEGIRMPLNWLSNRLESEEEAYPSVEVDGELLRDIKDRVGDENGGPLLLIRPPRENEGMDASTSIYETLHNPREKKVGIGPFSIVQNKAHAHAHEIWYHNDQMQFFLRPKTRVDANKIRRQVRSNYPNVDISEADTRFPDFEVGEYVSVAEIGLKRDFYFPIKSKLHNDDSFELDPYGDITSDMVVEEDETSDGQRVEAKDCKLVVQTIFEAARNVWSSSRPYGVDVNNVAQGMKEGEVHGNMIKGFDTRNPSALRKKTAKILETLQGSKAYYITMRVIAISPYEEIAQRRCRNVAQDFETYYNSVTQQGLTPIELTEDEMREKILDAARREHEYGFRDRFLSTGKFVQPVEALGAIAHIPNEDINTPVVDWAKQDTGPGTPSSGVQLEDQKRETKKTDETGRKGTLNQTPDSADSDENAGDESSTVDEPVLEPDPSPNPEPAAETTANQSPKDQRTQGRDTIDRWKDSDTDSGGVSSRGSETRSSDDGWSTVSGDGEQGEPDGSELDSRDMGWGTEEEHPSETNTERVAETGSQPDTDSSDNETEDQNEDRDSSPAFASKFENDGWGSSEEESSNDSTRRR